MSRNFAIRTPRRSLTLRTAGMFLAAALVSVASVTAQAQIRRPLRPAPQRFAYERAYLRAPEFAQAVQTQRRPLIVRRPPPPRQQSAPQVRPAAPPPQRVPERAAASTPAPIERPEPQLRPIQNQAGAPLQRPVPNNSLGGATTQLVNPNHPGQTQLHLAPWMESHRALPLAEQQRALDNEKGFRELPTQEQDRLHQQLTRLNAMPADQRARQEQKVEAMERLAPAQRKQVNNTMAQLGSLPEYRQHVVGRTFYQLRDMPPAQRQAYMNSAQFHSQFSEQERRTINGLLEITPIWPPIQAQQPPH